MIWYQQEVTCQGKPDHIVVQLVGRYNHPLNLQPDQSIIEISVNKLDNNTGLSHKTILFKKNPSTLLQPDEYIDPDMIKSKYAVVIPKLIRKINKSDISNI